jgi:hypothetical protein
MSQGLDSVLDSAFVPPSLFEIEPSRSSTERVFLPARMTPRRKQDSIGRKAIQPEAGQECYKEHQSDCW